jgi:hypothetical protein
VPANNSSFDLRAFDDYVRMHGEVVNYFRGARCPCGSDPAQADFSCPRCHGLGHFYPQPAQQIIAIVGNVNMNREMMSIPGFVLPGDLTMTMRPLRGHNIMAADWDKAVLTWGDGLPLDGESITASPTGQDVLAQQPVDILNAYGQDLDRGLLTFVLGTDFAVAGQVVTWLTNNRPPAGTVFTIKYTAQPDWIVFVPPRPKYERGTSLGQTVVLRKRTIVLGRNE